MIGGLCDYLHSSLGAKGQCSVESEYSMLRTIIHSSPRHFRMFELRAMNGEAMLVMCNFTL